MLKNMLAEYTKVPHCDPESTKNEKPDGTTTIGVLAEYSDPEDANHRDETMETPERICMYAILIPHTRRVV